MIKLSGLESVLANPWVKSVYYEQLHHKIKVIIIIFFIYNNMNIENKLEKT